MNIVATQFPTDVSANFTATVEDGKELAAKYHHLVDVDPYNAVERDQLDDAIRDVSSCRVTLERERKSYLKPFTEHSRAVNSICKLIASPIMEVEGRLKQEKQRVDAFIADRHAALQKEWRAACVALESRGQVKYGMGLDALEKNLEWLKSVDPLDECFGELTADASAARSAAIMNTVNAIDTEEDRREVAAARVELDAVREALESEKAALAQAQAEVLEVAQTASCEPVLQVVTNATPAPLFGEAQLAEVVALLTITRTRLESAKFETAEIEGVSREILKYLRAATRRFPA